MENNPSKKKFRGFKYSILVLLIFVAFGLAWFSLSGPQSGERQATVKDKASSLVADAKDQGKNLMDKAGDIKEGVSDTISKGRDKVSAMASDAGDKAGEMAQAVSGAGDKAGEMVQAASDAGSDLVERVQTTAEAGKDWIDGAASAIDSSEAEMEDTGPSADMSEQASDTLSEGRSQVNEMMDDTSESMMEASSSTMANKPTMSLKDNPSLSFKDTPSDTHSDTSETGASTQMGEMDPSKSAMSDKPMSNQMTDTASAMVQDQSGEAMAKTSDSSGSSSIRCIGTPPNGEDKGDHYIVAFCETMSIISERTGVGIDDLKNRNPQVDNPDLIFPNQRLWLPPRG